MSKLCATLLLMFAAVFSAAAQSPDEDGVARAVEALTRAMLAPDKAAFERLLADELSYGHSSPKVDTKASYIDALMSGKSAFKTIDITKQTIQLVGDLAIVRGHFSSDIAPDGKPGHVELELLMVWQKRGGEWKLLARQGYKST